MPGTELDTARATDRAAIGRLMLGRGMTVVQLDALVTELEAVRELSPFEHTVLKYARHRRAEVHDINAVYDAARDRHGVWTMATVLVDHARRLVTEPARAGAGAGGGRVHHAQPTELTESEHDSEVTTLAHLTDFFFSSADLSAWKHVNVILSGSMGPCDGCKERIEEFVARVDALARNVHVQFRLVLDVSYSTATNASSQRRTTYGYSDDVAVVDMPDTAEQYTYWTKRFVRDCG